MWHDDLHVAAVSTDSGDRATVVKFVKSLDLHTLPVYLDPNGYVGHLDGENPKNAPFAIYGMPFTYLIASSGTVLGYMPGATDWSAPQADELIRYLREH